MTADATADARLGGSARPTGVAVVGCGYWGPNVLRNFAAFPDVELRAICDRDPDRLAPLRRTYPALRAVTDFAELFDDERVEAVAICTPVQTHHDLARAALLAGRHVMLEKPLTDSVASAASLVELAEERGLTLHVDHTFVYTGAIQKIRSIIDRGDLGNLHYLDSVRINLGLFQSDVNVVWDLAPHDVSIMTYLIDAEPLWVSAHGIAHYGSLESQAYLVIKYPESLIAHIHVNWLAPVKLRSTVIGGSKQMIVYDDLEPSEKVRVYDKGVTLSDGSEKHKALVDYRTGDMFAPYIDKTEPLSRACRAFLDAIASGEPSPTGGRAGLAVVRVLEAAQRSLQKDGERVQLADVR